MSKPWRPDEEIARVRSGGGKPLPARPRLSDGAKAGLLLMAAACLCVAIGLYELAGPRDVFEREAGTDWSAVEDAR